MRRTGRCWDLLTPPALRTNATSAARRSASLNSFTVPRSRRWRLEPVATDGRDPRSYITSEAARRANRSSNTTPGVLCTAANRRPAIARGVRHGETPAPGTWRPLTDCTMPVDAGHPARRTRGRSRRQCPATS
jgi:hypothetical protein